MKRQLNRLGVTLIALVLSSAVFYSCKKNTSDYVTLGAKFSNSEMTTATFMGQILKEDGSPLDGATVSTGTHMMTSDADGFFYFSKISTPKNATLIKVEKTGYFDGFRTVRVIPNEDNHLKIMVMDLPTPKTFMANTGGSITIDNGGSIDFPANAIVDEATGLPYTGGVSVYAKWIDPTGADLNLMMPGDLRAINEDDEERGLTSYGMQAVELVGSSGQKLQLGNNQTANVKFPIPSSILSSAPASIPLWHFDEVQGMWVEDGAAMLNGNEYSGEVSHFSYWNCDDPFTLVSFQATFVDQSNNPVTGALCKLTVQGSTWNNVGVGYTNSNGTTTGQIPQNSTFLLELSGVNGCASAVFYSQNLTSTTANINLGTITVTVPTVNSTILTGTVVDCSNAVLANAIVKIASTNPYSFQTVTTNASGAFTVTYPCPINTNVTIKAYDLVNAVSGTSNSTLVGGTTNNVGNIAACGAQFDFINWDVTNPPSTTPVNYTITEPSASFYQTFNPNTYIWGSDNSNPANGLQASFSFDGPQSTTGTHNLQGFYDHVDSISSFTPAVVNLTSYGTVGSKISGSFSTSVNGSSVYNNAVVNCSFRVTRQN